VRDIKPSPAHTHHARKVICISWPVSRVLSPPLPEMDDHSSGMHITAHLKQPTRATICEWIICRPYLVLLPVGFTFAGPVTSTAVRSYRTLSPLLCANQVCSKRSALCGTIPRVAPAGRYPAPYSHGARTFLQRAPGQKPRFLQRSSSQLIHPCMYAPCNHRSTPRLDQMIPIRLNTDKLIRSFTNH